ncbi:MAG: hypothetical protein HW409_377 [candidate division NC10 bacterium]|nr:hypothetical protein [candidate division NC10 bacterium]
MVGSGPVASNPIDGTRAGRPQPSKRRLTTSSAVCHVRGCGFLDHDYTRVHASIVKIQG